MKRKKNKITYVTPAKKDKVYPELRLLLSKVVLAMTDYLDYGKPTSADNSMRRIFKDYKNNKQEVKEAVLKAIKFLTKDRYAPHPDYPSYKPTHPKPPRKRVRKALVRINGIAKEIWKKS
jgi:hypothetical protein